MITWRDLPGWEYPRRSPMLGLAEGLANLVAQLSRELRADNPHLPIKAVDVLHSLEQAGALLGRVAQEEEEARDHQRYMVRKLIERGECP